MCRKPTQRPSSPSSSSEPPRPTVCGCGETLHPSSRLNGPALAVSRVLQQRCVGPDVRLLQQVLREAFPFYEEYAGKLTLDGVYGTATGAWVTQHQREQGLPETGVAGPVTLRTLGLS